MLTGGWPGRCRSWKAEACGSRTAALARLWLFFLFLLSCSLLLLPLAVRLFYCSSSFFSFFFPGAGEGEADGDVEFCLLASCFLDLLFVSFLVTDSLLCCRWFLRMVLQKGEANGDVFSSYFSLLGGRSHAGFFLLGLAPVCFSRLLFPHVAPVSPFSCSFFLCLFFFSVSCLYRLSVLSLLGLFPSSPPFRVFFSVPPCFFFLWLFAWPKGLWLL